MSSTRRMTSVIRDARLSDVASRYDAEMALKEKQVREEAGKKFMKTVVNCLYENCPVELSNEVKFNVEAPLRARGTKNVIGMINHIDNCVNGLWPGWRKFACGFFNINI